jgi:hypothetical protein
MQGFYIEENKNLVFSGQSKRKVLELFGSFQFKTGSTARPDQKR